MVQDNSKILRKQYLEKRLEERIFKVDKHNLKKTQGNTLSRLYNQAMAKIKKIRKG